MSTMISLAICSTPTSSPTALWKADLKEETVLPRHCRYEEVDLHVVRYLAGEEIVELLARVAAFLLK
ncbi:hypothetical protein TIFTF001_017286 [Ficus carica]|uniref:Uncharacterized protein n=1 Tax=Ficus carica TaxID=3494 RepID=A0AA88A998_FICCA|nr:hypothetical protein TIFTF001_017286 [Ficus carica]